MGASFGAMGAVGHDWERLRRRADALGILGIIAVLAGAWYGDAQMIDGGLLAAYAALTRGQLPRRPSP